MDNDRQQHNTNMYVDNVLRVFIGYATQLFVSFLPQAQQHAHHNGHAMVCLIVVACALELVLCAHQALFAFGHGREGCQ